MSFVFRVLLACIPVFYLHSASLADDRSTIVDVAFDTRPFLQKLASRGVTVIGRYYSRCAQPEIGLRSKRLLDQGHPSDPNSEVSRIQGAGFAILSIYQYYNNSAKKFDGRRSNGRVLRNAECKWDGKPRSTSDEAQLDAHAAVKQAEAAGQPRGSAIYFGVDFNFDPSHTSLKRKIIKYFEIVKSVLGENGYKVGAYGSGFVNQMLLDEGLIEFAWISASRAFAGTSAFHTSGRWHLFQSQVDKEWFGQRIGSTSRCSSGLILDVNVQNTKQSASIGFWKTSGPHSVNKQRTKAIYEARRFACDGNALVRKNSNSSTGDLITKHKCKNRRFVRLPRKISHANTARIGDASGTLIEVDIDEDGTFDGWTWSGNLTKDYYSKPRWIHNRTARQRARCN